MLDSASGLILLTLVEIGVSTKACENQLGGEPSPMK